MRLWRIEKTSGGKSIQKKVVTESACPTAVIGVEIVVVNRSTTKVDVTMSAQIGPGTGRDIEHTAKTVAVFGREPAGHQVHSFENLRTNARTELGLRVVQKRNPVDKLV